MPKNQMMDLLPELPDRPFRQIKCVKLVDIGIKKARNFDKTPTFLHIKYNN